MRAHLVFPVMLGLFGAVVLGSAASAAAVLLPDNYWGGRDYFNYGDVIGDPAIFGITDASIERVNSTELKVVIDTNYAGNGGVDDTGYGALFFNTGANAWHPDGTGPNYGGPSGDVYAPGKWNYAFTMPSMPGSGDRNGGGGLFHISDGTVELSSVDGNPISYGSSDPSHSNTWIFREGQPVQFDPSDPGKAVGLGTWDVNAADHSITFLINDGGRLGDDFAIAWAMTCANDAIQGQVSIPPVPLPGALPLMASTLGSLGIVGWCRRRRTTTV